MVSREGFGGVKSLGGGYGPGRGEGLPQSPVAQPATCPCPGEPSSAPCRRAAPSPALR